MRNAIVPVLASALALALVAVKAPGSLAQVGDACDDAAIILDLPISLSDLTVGDCVAVEFPPQFRTLIVTSQSVNPPVSTLFYSDAGATMQRFDTQFERDNIRRVPETGFTFINHFATAIRYNIDYTVDPAECTTSVLNGAFVAPSVSNPAEFQGVVWLGGRRVAIFVNLTGDTRIESTFLVTRGVVTRIPVTIVRRSPFSLNTEFYYDFLPRTLPSDLTPPDFCDPLPPPP